MLKEFLTQIADTLRTYLNITNKINAREFPQMIALLFDTGWGEGWNKGYEDGYLNGYDQGEAWGWDEGYESGVFECEQTHEAMKAESFAEGEQAEYDRFWDIYQQNGNRTGYTGAFSGAGWTLETFKPKYDIKGAGDYMFSCSAIEGDMVEILKGLGIEFSPINNLVWVKEFFFRSKFTRVGVIDLSKVQNGISFFQESSIETVDELIFSETTYMPSLCTNWKTVKNLKVSGVIAGSLSFAQSTAITPESMKSVISCLKNYAGTDKAFTYKITFPAERWTALEADSTAPNGITWKEYVTSLGWNA